MPPSIEELDLMVQSFYDGRGEQVSRHPGAIFFFIFFLFPAHESLRFDLVAPELPANAALFPALAKSCPNRLEPGK